MANLDRFHWNPSTDHRFGRDNLAGRSRRGRASVLYSNSSTNDSHFAQIISAKIFKKNAQSPPFNRSIPKSRRTSPQDSRRSSNYAADTFHKKEHHNLMQNISENSKFLAENKSTERFVPYQTSSCYLPTPPPPPTPPPAKAPP